MLNTNGLSNAHTHSPQNTGPALYSPYLPLTEKIKLGPQTFFTLGIHPWWVDKIDFASFLTLYDEYKGHPQFVGLGEMGLDRNRPHFQLQNDIFAKQLNLAMQDNIKRIVLHSVKSTSDLLFHLKPYKNKILWHDYRGNPETTKQLLKFDSYFSINQLGLKEKIVKSIPLDRLLIETDEKNEINLGQIHEKMAKLLALRPELLQERVNQNFMIFLGD